MHQYVLNEYMYIIYKIKRLGFQDVQNRIILRRRVDDWTAPELAQLCRGHILFALLTRHDFCFDATFSRLRP